MIFQLEVERQLNLKIYAVRSDRGGEYYSKIDQDEQHYGPFYGFLKDQGIIAQYTTPGSPEQNGVCECHNCTYQKIICSMMSHTDLPKNLWGECLRYSVYILNRVPSKSVVEVPHKTWIGKNPSLNHLHVWGCPAEVKLFNPTIIKLEPRIVSCFFIGFIERSKGYRFYCPSRPMKIVECARAHFIEDES